MDDLTAIMNTAMDFQNQGRLNKAEAIYLKVLEIDASNADAFHYLGLIYHTKGDFKKAAEAIGSAITIDPGVAAFHANLAASQLALGQPALAENHAVRAVELDKSIGTAHYNLGNAYFALGKTDRAVSTFRTALEQDPTNDHFWTNYLFALNFAPSTTRQLVFEENYQWGKAQCVSGGVSSFMPSRRPGHKLKLAYYLPELDRHVTVRFLDAMLPFHNRDKFEVLIYGYRSDGGPAPKSLFKGGARWIDVGDRSEKMIAELIREDQVNILLHPCTFKARYRKLLAYWPAPLNIACVNLVSTTGMNATTHLVTDPYLDPPGKTERYYTERLIRLPFFNVYEPPHKSPEPSQLPARKNGFITFGSFNNPAKLTPETLSLWVQILTRLPDSRLFLKHRSFRSVEVQEEFTRPFGKANIDIRRIEFEGFSEDSNIYLSAYHKVDIGLDPIPFGGGTTTYESIWMGVPVVTHAGENIMGRLSASLMHRLGLSEFVCENTEDYVEIALSRASAIESLSRIRESIRGTSIKSIFNGARYMAELEEKLCELWRDYYQTK